MALALLCSGQGRQHPEMLALTGTAPEAEPLFRHAARLLGGRDPREIVRNGDDALLHQNRVGQILCCLQALAAAAVLREHLPLRIIVAGYSLGEAAAWSVAGVLDPIHTLDLVARRAELMDAASPPGDGLFFVRGLARAEIDRLCARHGAAVAIVDPGSAFVLGGSRADLALLGQEAIAAGATRVVPIEVGVASHTSRLAAATLPFLALLRQLPLSFPPATGTRLLSGIDGAPVLDAGAGMAKLAAQIATAVQWSACLQSCIEAGATAFLELGPGSVLAGMAAEVASTAPARSLDEFRSMAGARSWLARWAAG